MYEKYLFGLLLGILIPVYSNAQSKIFWIDPDFENIWSANYNGTQVKGISSSLRLIDAICVDTLQKKLYWHDGAMGGIYFCSFDGSIYGTVNSGLDGMVDLTIDYSANKLYWVKETKIERANMDGTNVETLITYSTNTAFLRNIAVDPAHGKMYWVDNKIKAIRRANMDGSGVQNIYVSTNSIGGMELDLLQGKVYWAENATASIYRINLDGGPKETVVDLNGAIYTINDIALDIPAQKIYFSDSYFEKIYRVGFNGTGLEYVAPGYNLPTKLAIMPSSNFVFFSMGSGSHYNQIRRITTTTNESKAIRSEYEYLNSIAVHEPSGKIYFTEDGTNGLYRMNFDGSFIERVTGLSGAGGVVVDPAGKYAYVAQHNGTSKGHIARIPLGSSESPVNTVTNQANPEHLAIDFLNQKLYWTDDYPKKLKRADLNGTGIEILIGNEIDSIGGLAVDPLRNQLYFTDVNAGKILKMDLDSLTITALVTGLSHPFGIALDLVQGKVYWGENWSGKIKRANLNGSAIETLVSYYTYSPTGIAIDRCQVFGRVEAEICAGSSFSIGQNSFTQAGVYISSTVAANGCDSIVELKLTVRPLPKDTIRVSTCAGTEYLHNNISYTNPGIYTQILPSSQGCDSILTIMLQNHPRWPGIGPDTAILIQDTLTLNISADMQQALWPDGTQGTSFIFAGLQYGDGVHAVSVFATDSFGCTWSDTLRITVSTPSLVSGPDTGQQWQLLPNPLPAGARLSLQYKGQLPLRNLKFQVCDIAHKCLITSEVPEILPGARYYFSPAEMAPGVYYLRITGLGQDAFSHSRLFIQE